METRVYPKIVVLAVYFGNLPEYFPLWLKSCSYNPGIEFRIITDADIQQHTLPKNVSYRKTSLHEVVKLISLRAQVELDVREPYKLCDLKPIFWALLDSTDACDFWGHCDLDMIFGDLSHFLPECLFLHYDKIFSVGHFTLYRNDIETNNFFRKAHPELEYRTILSDPSHRGFDEHIGVNRIWLRHKGRFYRNEALIADIDPHIRRFECSSYQVRHRNSRHQVFMFDKGQVKRIYWSRGIVKATQYMYIHFQKRSFEKNLLPQDCEKFYITPLGFVSASDVQLGVMEMDTLNGKCRFDIGELRHRLRRIKRLALGSLRKKG